MVDTGFAPWQVRPHYKTFISSSPQTFGIRPKPFVFDQKHSLWSLLSTSLLNLRMVAICIGNSTVSRGIWDKFRK